MGVYIKGVEMPKDGEHPYWVTIHSDGTVEYNENNGQGWQTSEAVPVPPHGRLVDADALLEWANAGLKFGDPDFHAGLWHAVSAIEDALTISPAEEEETT